MSAWRLMIVAVGLMSIVPASRAADTVPLVEAVQPGDCFRIQLEMKLDGELRVQRQDATQKLELKAVATILPIHEVQLRTYLRMSGIHVGLLLNFNVPRLMDGFRRYVN